MNIGPSSLRISRAVRSSSDSELGRKKRQFDVQLLSQSLDYGALLIGCVVHDQGHWKAEILVGNALQQLADAVRADVGMVCDRDEFMGDRVQCTEDVEAWSPGGSFHEKTRV